MTSDYLEPKAFHGLAEQTITTAKLMNGLISSIKSRIPSYEPPTPRERGSIFLEILITLGILSVASVGLLLAILYGVQINLRATHLTVAAEIASQELEILRQLPVDNLPLQSGGPLIGNPQPPLSQLPHGSGTLTIADLGTLGTKQVTVQIHWSFGNQPSTLTYATLMTTGGLSE